MKVIEFLKGKKTYIVAVVIAVLGVLQGTGLFTLPEAVWPVIAALGLTTIRQGVQSVAKAVKPPDGISCGTVGKSE